MRESGDEARSGLARGSGETARWVVDWWEQQLRLMVNAWCQRWTAGWSGFGRRRHAEVAIESARRNPILVSRRPSMATLLAVDFLLESFADVPSTCPWCLRML